MLAKQRILILLTLLFLTPGVLAWLTFKHPEWLQEKSKNQGAFVSPPILLPALGEKSKWALMLWEPEKCAKMCKMTMEKLAKIRLALGRRLYEVELQLVQNPAASTLSSAFQARLREQDVKWTTLSAPNLLLSKPRTIYIADREHRLILVYPADAPPEAIFQDLSHLLTVETPRRLK